ncbi:MAG: hypothetical protein IKP01_04910, partial [Bacteroidales bacterium]|nr:hypothetical protein [Bacteroidales bacterium]
MSYTIGVDLGSTNTKMIAVSDDGRILCERSHPTEVISVPTGGELDPKQIAIDLLHLISEVTAEVRSEYGEPLSGIGLTGMAEAGCLVDLNGDPLTPILLWYDQRGGAEAEELRAEHETELTCVSGIRMSNVATIYKQSYLKKQLPVSVKKMRWFGVPEWAGRLLTAEHFTDRTLAVRTGAYSLKTDSWSPDALRITGLDEDLFPEIIPALCQNIPISPEVAAYLGIPETTRVFIAGHDDLAAAYGAGLCPGCWVDSTGTAEGLIALTSPCPPPEKTVRQRMSIAPWYTPDQWALIAGVGTSGGMLAELQRQTGLSFGEIDRIAADPAAFPADALTTELTPQRLAKVEFRSGLSDAQKVSAVYARILSSF